MNAYRETCEQCMNRKLLDESQLTSTSLKKKSEPKQWLGIISRAALLPGCSLGIATTCGLIYSIFYFSPAPHLWSVLTFIYVILSLIVVLIVVSVYPDILTPDKNLTLSKRVWMFSWAPFVLLMFISYLNQVTY